MAILSTLPPCAQPEAGIQTRLGVPVLLRLWHLTSLDAPTVAVVWTLAFAWIAHIRLPAWPAAVIGLSAWSVYIGDRLLDARKAQTPLRARHHFHWKHRRVFIPIAIFAAIAAVALVIHSMPYFARERNSILAAAALAYFTSVHSPWRSPAIHRWHLFPKELLVGVLFTLACAAPTLTRIAARSAAPFAIALFPAILTFIALAWLNCHAIESWESRPHGRFTLLLPAAAIAATAAIAAILEALLRDPRQAALLLLAACSAGLLALLDRCRHNLTPIALRVCADLVLLTPICLLVFSWQFCPGRIFP